MQRLLWACKGYQKQYLKHPIWPPLQRQALFCRYWPDGAEVAKPTAYDLLGTQEHALGGSDLSKEIHYSDNFSLANYQRSLACNTLELYH